MPNLQDILNEQEKYKDQSDITAKMLEIKDQVKKDKSVTIRVNSTLYENFTEICRNIGASNNGMITMLITRFVNENKNK